MYNPQKDSNFEDDWELEEKLTKEKIDKLVDKDEEKKIIGNLLSQIQELWLQNKNLRQYFALWEQQMEK